MVSSAIGAVVAVVIAIATALGIFFGLTDGDGISQRGMENIGMSSESKAPISKEQALEIALKDAGLTADQVIVDRGDPEYDYDFEDGTAEWEIDFRLKDDRRADYEYEIDAVTGKLLKAEKPRTPGEQPSQPVKPVQPVAPKVSADKAIETALKDAGFTLDKVRLDFGDPELDRHKGQTVWELEFTVIATGVEYDYKISTETGEVVSKSIDRS